MPRFQRKDFLIRQTIALVQNTAPYPIVPLLQRWQARTTSLVTDSPSEKEMSSFQNNMFALRPPRTLLRGTFSALRNLVITTFVTPATFFIIVVSGLREQGAIGLISGVGNGVIWSSLLATFGMLASAQQLALGASNSLLSPLHFVKAKEFDVLTHRWITFSTTPRDDLINADVPDAELIQRGEQRYVEHRQRMQGFSSGPSKFGSSFGGDTALYDTLGVEPNADTKEIKAAYTRLAILNHPDKNPSMEAKDLFQRATAAYKVLANPKKRAEYDAHGETATESGSGSVHVSKREALRMTVGGDEVILLVGDVRVSQFWRRAIDDAFLVGDEVATLEARQRERCTSELLKCLDGADNPDWTDRINARLRKLSKTGLAKEVFFVVGLEYAEAARYAEGTLTQRLFQWVRHDFAGRAKHRMWFVSNFRNLFVRFSSEEHRPYVIDLVWHLSVPELRGRAWVCALRVLLDASVSAKDRRRRLEALKKFAAALIGIGRRYEGATEEAVRCLNATIADHFHETRRKR